MVTQSRLIELFNYDVNTGLFTRIIRSSPNTKIGEIAGYKAKNGYVVIFVDSKAYKAHRLAWLFVNGNFPEYEIDHINGIKHDNRINNLREAKHCENAQNRKTPKNNAIGLIGAFFNKSNKKYISKIVYKKTKYHLGCFETAEEAHAAYCRAKSLLHTFNPVPRDCAKQSENLV